MTLAISSVDHSAYGCPYCGFRSGYSSMNAGSSATWSCGECDQGYIVLGPGVTVSQIGVGRGNDPAEYPTLSTHPRAGTPAHGAPDKQPPGGGEYFRSRGVGTDYTPGCFVCGGTDGLHGNIAAFVACKAAGERVAAMFKAGARLDYREFEPDRVQVKIGACKAHVLRLEWLHEKTSTADGTITQAIVDEAMQEQE